MGKIKINNSIEEIASQYTHLKKSGSRLIGLCPIHSEDTPSFTVYPDTQSWFCFGCSNGGDAIKLIQLVEKVDFKGALAYLGIEKAYRSQKRDIKKKALVKAFRIWEREYHNLLATIYRTFLKMQKGFKTMEEVEEFAALYHEMPKIEYKLNILSASEDKEKLELFRRVNYGQEI